jgi:spore germination protein GerM
MKNSALFPCLVMFLVVAALSFLFGLKFCNDKTQKTDIVDEMRVEGKMSYRQVKIFYYDERDDCNNYQALIAFEREIEDSGDLEDTISKTLEVLMEGKLKKTEQSSGALTIFPLYGVELKAVELSQEGELFLTFYDPYFETSGGSCNTSVLVSMIEATAKQFPEVKSVKILPLGEVFGA